jgi:YD repeat-containing protein
VLVTWASSGLNSTAAPYKVFDGTLAGTLYGPFNRDQQKAPQDAVFGAGWSSLGAFTLTQTTLTVQLGGTVSGRVVADSVRIIERPETSFVYDAASNVTSRTDRNGRRIEYDLDDLNRVAQERWYASGGGLENTLNYGYNLNGQLTSAGDGDSSHAFTIDGLGRTISTVATITGLPSTVTLDESYDSRNNRTQAAFKIGATNDFKNTYQYDPLSRTTQIVQQGNGGNTVNAKRVDFSYDAAGQWQKLSRYSDTAGTQLVAASGYTFDRLGRLTNLAHLRNSAEVAGYRLAYDAAGRLVRIDSSIDEVSQFSYDKRGQLTAADNTFEKDEAYAYDASGNRTSGGSVVHANNRLTSDATYTYAYDDEGNRTSRTHKVSGDKEEYAWDQRNRLVGVTFSQKTGPRVIGHSKAAIGAA